MSTEEPAGSGTTSLVEFMTTRPEPEAEAPEAEETEEVNAEAEEVEDVEEDATEAEEEEGEPEAEAEEAEVDEDEDDDPLVTIETKSGDVEVRFSELQQGYLRQQDYSRKTAELAEQRKAAEQDATQARELQSQLEAALTEWAVSTSQPNWVELAEKLSPQEFQIAQARHAQEAERADQAKQQLQQLKQERLTTEMNALRAAIPAWEDAAAMQAGVAGIQQVASELGFSAQEIEAVDDHRMFLALNELHIARAELAKLREGQKATAKKVVRVPKALQPGAKPAKVDAAKAKAKKARERLKAKQGGDGSFADWLTTP